MAVVVYGLVFRVAVVVVVVAVVVVVVVVITKHAVKSNDSTHDNSSNSRVIIIVFGVKGLCSRKCFSPLLCSSSRWARDFFGNSCVGLSSDRPWIAVDRQMRNSKHADDERTSHRSTTCVTVVRQAHLGSFHPSARKIRRSSICIYLTGANTYKRTMSHEPVLQAVVPISQVPNCWVHAPLGFC